ncbi:DUF2442 domain-containing protein [Dechloromonas denitrificans]|uniref:DUF2442 domain-containing protein n=1 Tax=Dechloromonas denitrificans TaxID=281362 RepID=UPI0009FB7A6F|nr:DUF2442 domain-containing protein [Dechloromonas denitrificans]
MPREHPTSSPSLPEVIAVEPMLDRWLKLTFATGEIRQYDVDPWLSKGMFQALRDPLLFRQAFVQHGTVCWPGNLDIDPECLSEKSVPWSEPSLRDPNEPVLSREEALALRAAGEWRLVQRPELRKSRGTLPCSAGESGQPIPMLSTVVTLTQVPKGTSGLGTTLAAGTLGTVIEPLDEYTCLVEFAAEDGVSAGEVPLRYDELLPVSRVVHLVNESERPNFDQAVADMQAFVEEGQALARATAEPLPKPPTGFASWLDYAVECVDTRSAELEHLFDDTGAVPSRAAMEQAVRKELTELRVLAALQARLGQETTGNQGVS